MFFNEIDEGLWFYLTDWDWTSTSLPCPAAIRATIRLMTSSRTIAPTRPPSESIADLEAKRQVHDKQALIAWLDQPIRASPYLLIRDSLYERFAGDLAGRVTPLFRETGMKRNELILLQVVGRQRSRCGIATTPGPTRR